MAHEVAPGVWAELRFRATSSRWRTSATGPTRRTRRSPPRCASPTRWKSAGTRIAQTVTLVSCRGCNASRPETTTLSRRRRRPVRPSSGAAAPTLPLPPIGLGIASHGQPLTATGDRPPGRLAPCGICGWISSWPTRPIRNASGRRQPRHRRCGVPLEIALFVTPDAAETELAQLRPLLDALRPQVCRWLIFPAQEMFRGGTPLREVIEPARTGLAGYGECGARFGHERRLHLPGAQPAAARTGGRA